MKHSSTMWRKITLLAIISVFSISTLIAQKAKADKDKKGGVIEEATFDGQVVKFLIGDNGDTIILADLAEIPITQNRYSSRKEQYHYRRVKARALKVYPYAAEAIKLFYEVQEYTTDMKKRNRKRHIKRLQKELKKKFDEPLRKLSRYQGYVLMCMIERELDTSLFELVKGLRGWWSANYWNNIGKIYGYHLKDGYNPKNDPILENVLQDLDVSYQMAKKKFKDRSAKQKSK